MAPLGKHEQITQAEFAQRSQEAYGSSSREGAPTADSLSRAHALEHYSRTPKKKSHRPLYITLACLLVVILGGAVAAWAYVSRINSNLSKGVDANVRSALTDVSNDKPFYMLLLGIDKDSDRAESEEYGAADANYRTDTIILARLDPKNTKVTLVSIPRDTLVDLGSHGKAKINAAYSFGGAQYSIETVSKFAGVPISHFAQVDMDGFAAIVDSIGGVDVNLPVPVKDPNYTGLDLPAGEQHLDGETAGLLGRTRHAYDNYGGGDFYRAANQRMLISAVCKKVFSNPLSIPSVVDTASQYIKSDMQVTDIVALGTKFSGMDLDNNLYSGMCPTISKYINNTWYELCDTEKWKSIMQRVDQGLPPYTDQEQDFTAGVAGSAGISTSSETPSNTDADTQPEMSGSVAVLNGSGIAGAAGNTAGQLNNVGFTATAGNANQRDNTAIVYNGVSRAKALGVAQTLGLDSSVITSNDGTWGTSNDVIVVLGADWKN